MKKILIIEDDEKIAFALCVRLKACGYATWIAGDGIAGLGLALRINPDLILLDISLPAGSGFSLIQQFNQLNETRETPIILATASKEASLRERALELGAVGLLRKPYEADELLGVVRFALENWERSDPATFLSSERDPQNGQTRPRKVLIVEDDVNVARALSIRMKSAGYETNIANDALAGVRCAVQCKPDLVVLDISLPAGDGFTVAERIQSHIPTPTRIIFLTASKRPDFRQRAETLGASGFFEKPYEADALLDAVRQALGTN